MVTYKYFEVRREVFENCSDKGLNQYRSFRQMLKIWKWSYWALVICMCICMIAGIVLAVVFPGEIFCAIPVGVEYIVLFIAELCSEKLYNQKERKKELDDRKQCYKEYVERINFVLNEQGIRSREMREKLRKECTYLLEKHEQKFSLVNSRVFDMLVGVPLGALVSALIYKNSDAVIEQIGVIIFIGMIIGVIVKFIKMIKYYTDGYFKDRHLLMVLNEVEYFEEE